LALYPSKRISAPFTEMGKQKTNLFIAKGLSVFVISHTQDITIIGQNG